MSSSLNARLAAATSAIASASVPSRDWQRSRMQDLSRWICVSTKPATTNLPSMSSAGASAAMWRPISTIRPSAMAISTIAASPSPMRALRRTKSRAMLGAFAQRSVWEGQFGGAILACAIGGDESLLEIIRREDGCIFRLPPGRGAARQTFDHRVRIGIEKERDRIAIAAGWTGDAVRCRAIGIVAPTHQAIADVADEGAGDWQRLDPCPVTPPHFEATGIVGEQDRQAAVIGVFTRAWMIVLAGFAGRVVQQPQRRHRAIELVGEEVARQRQVRGDRQMQIEPEPPQRVEIADRGVAKAVNPRPEIDAAKWLAGDHLGIGCRQIEADVERLLEVGLDAIEAFGGDADIAAIVRRSRDRELILHGVGRCKECRRASEHARQKGCRHAMVANVKEADLAARAPKFGSDPTHCRRVARTEAVEIDSIQH